MAIWAGKAGYCGCTLLLIAYSAGPATIYTGIRYDMIDIETVGDRDVLGANLGVDYAIVPGLIATAEVSYIDVDGVDDQVRGLLQLSRTW